MEYGQVVSRAQEAMPGEHRATPAFAPSSVTIGALGSVDSLSSGDVLGSALGLGCGFSRMLGAALHTNREDRHNACRQPPHWDGSITSIDEAHLGKAGGGAALSLRRNIQQPAVLSTAYQAAAVCPEIRGVFDQLAAFVVDNADPVDHIPAGVDQVLTFTNHGLRSFHQAVLPLILAPSAGRVRKNDAGADCHTGNDP